MAERISKKDKAEAIATILEDLYPETPIPLDHKDPYTLLVAVLLSAQCTDARVNQVTPDLFELADNPFEMAAVPVEDIKAVIRPCGLSPRKSKAISDLSQILVEQYEGSRTRRHRCAGNFARSRAQDSFGSYVASLWSAGFPGGYSHTPACLPLGFEYG